MNNEESWDKYKSSQILIGKREEEKPSTTRESVFKNKSIRWERSVS